MCEHSVLKAVVDQGQLSNPYSKKNSHMRRDGLFCLPIQQIRDQGNYPLDRKYLYERERRYLTA